VAPAMSTETSQPRSIAWAANRAHSPFASSRIASPHCVLIQAWTARAASAARAGLLGRPSGIAAAALLVDLARRARHRRRERLRVDRLRLRADVGTCR